MKRDMLCGTRLNKYLVKDAGQTHLRVCSAIILIDEKDFCIVLLLFVIEKDVAPVLLVLKYVLLGL